MSIGTNIGLFTGIHKGKLDEKNRVTIPAPWRFDGASETTFLAMFHPALGTIMVFPPQMVQRIREAATQVTVSDPDKLNALRLLGENSVQVSCDKAGRITLNEHVIAQAALERDVVFSGSFTTFQIAAPVPPKVDREAESTRTVLRALRELGI
jgi:division/cell wall cluster transcriptional repressor MraZ